MDTVDEVMSTTSARPEKSESEYVSRKRKSKKKVNTSISSNFDEPKEASQDSGATLINLQKDSDDTNCTDNNNVIHSDKVSDVSDIERNEYGQFGSFKITKDAQLKAPPEIEEEETPPNETKELSLKEEVEWISENISSLQKTNTKALPKTALTYELEKFEKHALLIFNQENINGYKRRLGTEKDVEELDRTFSSFGFEVTVKHDFTKDEIMQTLEEYSSRDFTDYGCVVVVVLTHGSSNGLIRAKDQPFSELKIINNFKVDRRPTLVTKPKIVIIQACRGSEDIKGVPVFQAMKAKTQKDLDEEVEPYTLPVESDMLILHSSYIGKASHRHEMLGSWFIQSLCKKINELASTLDLESILTEVKREVAIDHSHEEYNKRSLEFDLTKQMPVTTSTLIRKLYLKRFNDISVEPSQVAHSHVDSASVEDRSVLDNAAPNTPMFIQFGPCSCFLEHYEYMKNCLKLYVHDHPDDSTASSFYNVACAFEEGVEFNSPKEALLRAISLHLSSTPDSSKGLRYLHPYIKK